MLIFLWFGIAPCCFWRYPPTWRVFPVGRRVDLWRVRQARARCHRRESGGGITSGADSAAACSGDTDMALACSPEDGRRVWAEIQNQRPPAPQPLVDLNRLSPAAKRQVWEYVKTHAPETAELLQSPGVQALRERFGARVHLPRSLVDEALHG